MFAQVPFVCLFALQLQQYDVQRSEFCWCFMSFLEIFVRKARGCVVYFRGGHEGDYCSRTRCRTARQYQVLL